METIMNQYISTATEIFLRDTAVGEYLILNNEKFETSKSVVDLLSFCNGSLTVNGLYEKHAEDINMSKDQLVNTIKDLLGARIVVLTPEHTTQKPFYTYDRPLSVLFELTYACDQKCLYCARDAGQTSANELSTSELLSVSKKIIDAKIPLVNITGGEPLLRIKDLLVISRYLSDNGAEVTLMTNSMAITEANANQIKISGINKVQISIDGHNAELNDKLRGRTGAFNKVLDNIKLLSGLGFEILLSTVISALNFDYLSQIIAFLESQNTKYKVSEVRPLGRGCDNSYLLNSEQFLSLLKKTSQVSGDNYYADIFPKEKCSIGSSAVIAPNGDIYPCPLAKDDFFYLGNIKENSFMEMWQSSPVLKEQRDFNVGKIDKCKKCWNKLFCGGGCRVTAYHFHGTIYKNDPYRCRPNRDFAKFLLKNGVDENKAMLKRFIESSRQTVCQTGASSESV